MTYARTVNSHTFMERSANHSTKGSRRGFVDVETGVSPADLLTLEQQRDNLKRKHAALAVQRNAVKTTRGGTKEEWQRLGREMFAVQQQITALNALAPKREAADFNEAFVMCAKTMMLPLDFERMAEAARRKLTAQEQPR